MDERSAVAGRPERALRRPHVAGTFYPSDASRLADVVDGLFDATGAPAPAADARRAPLIGALVPHAALRYSGAIAAAAWASIGPGIWTILIAGTNHFAWLDGIGVWAGGAWETPLGLTPIDGPWSDALLSLGRPFVAAVEEHLEEHSIEVQLPLVARACPGARIVPFLVSLGDLDRAVEAGRRLGILLREAIQGGDRVILVASSDLAHYPAERVARAVDERILEPILALDAPELAHREQAIRAERLPGVACGMCGIEPAVFTVAALAEAGARSATLLAHATSADVPGGDSSRVVGYAAVAFSR